MLVLIGQAALGLRVNPDTSATRRAAVGAALSFLPLAPLAAFAASNEGARNAATIIVRSESAIGGQLLVDASDSCAEMNKMIDIDREALQFLKDKAATLDEEEDNVSAIKAVTDNQRINETQVETLIQERKFKRCFGRLRKATDAEVYARADIGDLTVARTIERAKNDLLVDGTSATCKELEQIIDVDKRAIQFEKDKAEALSTLKGGGYDPEAAKIVARITKRLEVQEKRLEQKQRDRQCTSLPTV